jgi:PST family polysaccharide transporter
MTMEGDPEPTSALGRDAVKSASRRGVAINYSTQFVKFGLQFVYEVLLVRLLFPSDFGIYAMARPVLALGLLLTDLGLSQAVIQRDKITQGQLSILFWMNMLVTGAMCLLLGLSSDLIADFYGEPRVALVVIAMSGVMFLNALAVQHRALLNRKLAFGKLAIIDMVTFIAGAIAALTAAWSGLGVWSIVINQAVITMLAVILLWIMMPWRPGRSSEGFAGVRSLIGFGANIALANIANFFSRNIDTVLIGKVWGGESLGFYDRAYKLLLLPTNQVMLPITKVALPLLSRVQNDAGAYRTAYLTMLELVVLIIFPASIFAIVTHTQLIGTVLGSQWLPAAPIFAILAIGAMFAPISHSTSWLLISQGRTRELRNYGLVGSVGFVAAIVAGLPWGAAGVAFGYVLFGVVQGPIVWWLTTRSGPVDGRLLVGALTPYVLASLPVGGLLFLLQAYLPEGWATLGGLFVLSYLVFLLGLCLHPGSRRTLLLLLREAESLSGGRLKLNWKRSS